MRDPGQHAPTGPWRRGGERPSCSRSASATWSPTVKAGLRLVIGSWNTIARSRPRRPRQVRPGSPTRSSPAAAPRRRADAVRQQPHDGQRRHGLAAAALADDGQGLPGLDAEGDAIDGAQRPAVGGEFDREAQHLEHRLAHARGVPGTAAASAASMTARSKTPGWSRPGRKRRRCTKRSCATACSRRSSASGSGWSSTRMSRSG